MKKFVAAILLAAILVLTAAQVMAQDAGTIKIGTLSMLTSQKNNMRQSEKADFLLTITL